MSRRDDTQMMGDQIHFPTTSWTLVRSSRNLKALGSLVSVYWKPLYFFVRQQGFPNETAKDIVQEFTARGFDPEGYTLYTYGAVQAFAQAAAKAGSTKVEDLEKAMRSSKFDTVLGPVGFDAKGDVLNPKYVFFVWKDGKYAEM